MKVSVVGLFIAAFMSIEAFAARPNVVLIVADDLGYAELGCYGQKKIQTPHLNRLAAEGMRFTQFYCGFPVCAPSRCSLLTGKHSGHASIRDNKEAQPEGQQPLAAAEVTIAELLKRHGYATAAIGKWGLGMVGTAGDPNRQGFDLFFGYNCQRQAHSYYPSYLWRNDQRVELNNRPPVPGHAKLSKNADPSDPASYASFKGTDYAPDRLLDAALEFLRASKDRPFFLYYPTPLPHLALHVPDEDLKPYLGVWKETPNTGGDYTPHRTPRAAYAAMISRMDAEVGKLLAQLAELQLAGNTLIFFTSDNGATFAKQEVDYEFFDSVGPLRGLKGQLYEGGIRVPLIARWPGRIQAGTTSDHICAAWDLFPTICEATGIEPPVGIDGISLMPTLTGSGKQRDHEYLYWEFPGYGGQQAMRMGHWKAVRTNMARGDRKLQLFDLSKDVGERHDVSADHPQVVQRILQSMEAARTPAETDEWNKYLEDRETDRRK